MPKYEVWITVSIPHSERFEVEVEAGNVTEAKFKARERAEMRHDNGLAPVVFWGVDDVMVDDLLKNACYNVDKLEDTK